MRCYLFAVCGGVAIDQGTNNISLFELAEGVQLLPQIVAALGPASPVIALQSIACFALEETEIGRDFEVRLVWVRDDGVESPTSPQSLRAQMNTIRIRASGMRGPPSLGRFDVRIEWRPAGEQTWTREAVSWPLTLTAATVPPT